MRRFRREMRELDKLEMECRETGERKRWQTLFGKWYTYVPRDVLHARTT